MYDLLDRPLSTGLPPDPTADPIMIERERSRRAAERYAQLEAAGDLRRRTRRRTRWRLLRRR